MEPTHNEDLQKIRDCISVLETQQQTFQQNLFSVKQKLNRLEENIFLSNRSNKEVELPKEHATELLQPKKTVEVLPKPILQTKPLDSSVFDTKDRKNWEQIIGKRIVSIFGVVITFIGVIIGLRYAIEHGMFSPTARLISSYVLGASLFGIAIKLKSKYENYSAIVLSGSLMILYFSTFAGFAYYELLGNVTSFIILFMITLISCVAAIRYQKEVIAILGMVGAYAIPFLVGSDNGNTIVLLMYIGIVNMGILYLAMRNDWMILQISSFVFTYSILVFSLFLDLKSTQFLWFSTWFTLVFLLAFLYYKTKKKSTFKSAEILLMLSNAILYFTLNQVCFSPEIVENFEGLFTLWNALLYGVVWFVLYKINAKDTQTTDLTIALFFGFLLLFVPIQFTTSIWIFVWCVQVLVLGFLYYRNKNMVYVCLEMVLISIMSLFWMNEAVQNEFLNPFYNVHFFSGLAIVLTSGISVFIFKKNRANEVVTQLMFVFALLALYIVLVTEINFLFNVLMEKSTFISKDKGIQQNLNLDFYHQIVVILCSMMYLVFSYEISRKKFVYKFVPIVFLILQVILVFLGLVFVLYDLSELREKYLFPDDWYVHKIGAFGFWIRYLVLPFVVFFIYKTSKLVSDVFSSATAIKVLQLSIPVVVCWIVSSEFLSWMDWFGFTNAYKLISILWSIFALVLFYVGLKKNVINYRIVGLCLLIVVVGKLFLYDLVSQTAIFKTILFVTIGLLLLLLAFFYNRFKNDSETT